MHVIIELILLPNTAMLFALLLSILIIIALIAMNALPKERSTSLRPCP